MRHRIFAVLISSIMLMMLMSPTVYASSLDSVVYGNEQLQEEQTQQTENIEETPVVVVEQQTVETVTTDNNGDYIDSIKKATNLSQVPESRAAKQINTLSGKVASFIVKVISYFITAFLAVTVVIDLCYISLPFTRSILSNGYGGNAQAAVGTPGMQGPMNNGGMNPMAGMANGMQGGGLKQAMQQCGMQGSAPGASPAMGRVQWVSTAALNAVAAESQPSPNGKSRSALNIYAEAVMIKLIATTLLITLAVTGALSNLGFLIGTLLSNSINNIGNMM